MKKAFGYFLTIFGGLGFIGSLEFNWWFSLPSVISWYGIVGSVLYIIAGGVIIHSTKKYV